MKQIFPTEMLLKCGFWAHTLKATNECPRIGIRELGTELKSASLF